jgi:hypothetical protein
MAILTHNFRVSAASSFASTFSTENIYMVLARPQSWADNLSTKFSAQASGTVNDSNIPNPADNVLNETSFWRDAMAAAKIYGSNIRLCIDRINWTSGARYDMYRHNVSSGSPTENNNYDLSDSNFIVYVTSTGCVYKCLFNGRSALATTGTVSTVQPTTTGTAPQQTADGYIWKYLYTITSADVDFVTANYLPVNTAANSISSINGIDVITVENAGSGYTGTPGVIIYGDGTGASATATANTSTGRITGISVTNAGSGYTWAKIVLTGGGTPTTANAVAIIAPPGGHGSNLMYETHAHNVMIAGTVSGYEQGDFPVNQDFRTIALVKNPASYNSSIGWRVSSNTGTLFTSSSGRILRTLTMVDGSTAPDADNIITGSNSLASGLFVFQSSGTTRLEYIVPVNADEPESIDTTRIDTVTSFKLYDFNTSDTITATNGYSKLINSSTGITGTLPEIQPYTGQVLYLDYRRPVTRSAGQNEKINIVINF